MSLLLKIRTLCFYIKDIGVLIVSRRKAVIFTDSVWIEHNHRNTYNGFTSWRVKAKKVIRRFLQRSSKLGATVTCAFRVIHRSLYGSSLILAYLLSYNVACCSPYMGAFKLPCRVKADDGGHGGTVTTQLPDPSAITRQLTSLFLRLGCGMI